MEGKEDDASVFRGRVGDRVSIPWCAGWCDVVRSVVYILVVLGVCFGWSSVYAASYSYSIKSQHSVIAVNCSTQAIVPTSCSGSPINYPCYFGATTQGSLNKTTGVVTGGAFFGTFNIGTRTGIAVPVASQFRTSMCLGAEVSGSGPTYSGNQHYTLFWNSNEGTVCPEGYVLGANNVCELAPDDVCINGGGGEPYTSIITTTSSENPGLCAVGDFAEATSSGCMETPELGAGSYCTASVTTEVEYSNALPPTFTTTQYITYDGESETCEEPLPPIGPSIDPGECGPPPPTCGPSQTLQDGECVTYLPPINTYTPPTYAGPPSTTTGTSTSTTTTTTNPDGSVTTVTNTVSEFETEQGECPPGEKCDADYVGPDVGDEPKTFGESLLAFKDALEGSPIANAGADIGDAVPESSQCPTWDVDFEIAGRQYHYVVDGHCDAIEQHEDLMRQIMAIVWSLLALFILLGA